LRLKRISSVMRFGRTWPIPSTLYLCQLRKSYQFDKLLAETQLSC